MNHFKKSNKAIVKYFLQKLLGFSSIMCVFLSLKRRDDAIWYGTLCMLKELKGFFLMLVSSVCVYFVLYILF